MFLPELEPAWSKAMKENTSVRELKLKKFGLGYHFGIQFYMALKQRAIRLLRFEMEDSKLYSDSLYSFTAFVRKN